MSCDHTGPADVIAMAGAWLAQRNAAPQPGMRFRFAENHGGFFAAAVTEIEWRDGSWVVVRLDRLKEPLDAAELGFRELG